jgi:hypothetical protein
MLVDGHFDLPELAREAASGDLAALGRWAMQPDAAHTLTGLLRLADARTQLALGRYRMIAATVLARIITDQQPGELVRKACVDLLSIDPALLPKRSASAPATDRADSSAASNGLPRISEEAILRSLETAGRCEHERDSID